MDGWMGTGTNETRREEKDLVAFSQFVASDKVGFGWMEGVCEISSASQGALWETRDFFYPTTFWSTGHAYLSLS